jgi:hypothetical protein
MDASQIALLTIVAVPFTIDANLATLIGLVVTTLLTSVTTIIVSWMNGRKANRIETKVDAGNAMTASVETLTNGNNAALQQKLTEAHAEIARLNRQLPPSGQ